MRRPSRVFLRSVHLAAVLACSVLAWNASAQTPPAPGRGRGPIPVDPRVQIRMHHFEDTLIAKRRDQSGAVTRSRPLCAYPLVAKHNGSGSTDDAANFACSTGF